MEAWLGTLVSDGRGWWLTGRRALCGRWWESFSSQVSCFLLCKIATGVTESSLVKLKVLGDKAFGLNARSFSQASSKRTIECGNRYGKVHPIS